MLTALLIVFALIFGSALLLIVFAIALYNGLVRQRNLVEEGWSGIDVQLRRRFNLIGNLVSSVKGYMQQESEVLTRVTEMRTALNSDDPRERGKAEAQVSTALANVLAVAEDYPELKSNETFLQLQDELSALEDHIQRARRYYNGAVRDFNTSCQSFPAVLFAAGFGFHPADFFELDDDAQRAAPAVDFS